jgi:hypothetical protein
MGGHNGEEMEEDEMLDEEDMNQLHMQDIDRKGRDKDSGGDTHH